MDELSELRQDFFDALHRVHLVYSSGREPSTREVQELARCAGNYAAQLETALAAARESAARN
jgi:hypothetical protein